MQVLDVLLEERKKRLKRRQEDYRRKVAKDVDYFKTFLGPDSDETTRERTLDYLRIRSFGLPSMTTKADYWLTTYPHFVKDDLLDDGYWINAYTSIRASDATEEDGRVLKKFIHATMSLVHQAASSHKVKNCDVIEVLRNPMARNTLFHLVFCISRIAEYTRDLQAYRVFLAKEKPKFSGTTSDAPGMGDALVNMEDSEKLTERSRAQGHIMEFVLTAVSGKKHNRDGAVINSSDFACSDLGMAPESSECSENLMMDVPSELQDLAPVLEMVPATDDREISRLFGKICLILKEILATVGGVSDLADCRSSMVSVIKGGVLFLINDMKKAQDLLNMLLVSSVSNTDWEKLLSACHSGIRIRKELIRIEVYRSVYFLNNAYVQAQKTFNMVIDLLDPHQLWPVSSEGGLPGCGYRRMLLEELQKTGYIG